MTGVMRLKCLCASSDNKNGAGNLEKVLTARKGQGCTGLYCRVIDQALPLLKITEIRQADPGTSKDAVLVIEFFKASTMPVIGMI